MNSLPIGRRHLLLGALALLAAASPAGAHSDHSAHAMAGAMPVTRSEVSLTPAAVTLRRQDGQALELRRVLDDGRPVLVNFVFTTCTAICPVTSQVFAALRDQLGADRERVNMVSISIDPEYDTPRRLADYTERFKAGGSWNFFTGSAADSIAVQKSFDAYRGDKMNHVPVTFFRAAPGKPWVRLDGFASPAQLLGEVRTALAH